MRVSLPIAVCLALVTGSSLALEPEHSPNAVPTAKPVAQAEAYLSANRREVGRICDAIREAADLHGLPRAYFTRLIWKESRFDIKAISPVGAQGIAQFMPATAKERGLENPFDPAQAIPASAHYLADLKAQFGNWGLAAAAYNGGPDRVARFVKKRGGLPLETRDYVLSITYRPAEWFRVPGREVEPRPLDAKLGFDEACRQIPIVQTRAILATSPSQPWMAQLSVGINRSAAKRALDRARKRYRKLVSGRPTSIRRVRTAGILRYIGGVGVQSRTEAQLICAQVQRSRGHCVVRRNR
ncbi:MAG: lytic transglycosylase domain-containing protein [Pseudomonadota bacterium]